jgi:hypothetical protein
MPVGIPILRSSEHFKGNSVGEFFGFIDVDIQSPYNISVCVLGLDLTLENTGIIYPKGFVRGVYFSEELNLAISKGCRIVKIYKAYEFQRAIIFKEYVEKLYALRVSSKGLLNSIYKKLLNTLYGRFGCVYTNTVFTEPDIELGSYQRFMNVGIAAAITSYARIHMYEIIEPLSKHLLYTDTDGIFLDCRLPKEYVQNKLGCFKLVSENTACVFYGPKFYMYKRIGDNHYTKVFRGLPVNKYQFLIKDILSNYICNMKANKNSQHTTIEFNMQHRDTKVITRIQRVFFNKRIIYYDKQTIKEFLDKTIALENVLIFTIDLKAIHHRLIEMQLPYTCKTFEYNDKCYSLMISNNARSLVFKDYYHFLPFKEDSDFLDKYYSILLLSSIIKKDFNLDIAIRIPSIPSISINSIKRYKTIK